jgi:hypothetical protein
VIALSLLCLFDVSVAVDREDKEEDGRRALGAWDEEGSEDREDREEEEVPDLRVGRETRAGPTASCFDILSTFAFTSPQASRLAYFETFSAFIELHCCCVCSKSATSSDK